MSTHRVAAALVASAVFLLPPYASGQPAPAAAAPASPTIQAAAPAVPDAAPPAAARPSTSASIKLEEGTEVSLTLDDELSSSTSQEGDKFSVTVSDPITLADGTVIPAGYRGRGEVSGVEKRGMMGKAGQLSVRLEYIMLGDTKVRLRANKSQEGKSTQSTTIVLSLLVTPLFLLMKGKDAKIPKGFAVKGYVDSSVEVARPLVAPPVRQN